MLLHYNNMWYFWISVDFMCFLDFLDLLMDFYRFLQDFKLDNVVCISSWMLMRLLGKA